MGVVYKCHDVYMDRLVAIKMLASDHYNSKHYSQDQIIRFQQEARAAARFHHPNLVSILDFGISSDGAPFMVMEYVEGKTLCDAFGLEEGSSNSEEEFSLLYLLEIFIQCCEALACAHKLGVLHRDLKPTNIMLLTENDSTRVKILDFGSAKIADLGQMFQTKSGLIFGTPPYMSPEQTNGGTVDVRSDVYGLACILYECLTGMRPCLGQNPMETFYKHQTVVPKRINDTKPGANYPRELEALVARALEKNPADRPQSMLEFREALETVHHIVMHGPKSKWPFLTRAFEFIVEHKRASMLAAWSLFWLISASIYFVWHKQRVHDGTNIADHSKMESVRKSTKLARFATEIKSQEIPEKYRDTAELERLAKAGDPESQFWLGRLYGRRGEFDQAAVWYREAAERGHADAEAALGRLYMLGEGVRKDYNEGLRWAQQAADQGSALGKGTLGVAYLNGWGLQKNYRIGLKLIRESAEQGDSRAQHTMGNLYALGFGEFIFRNDAEALKWLTKAAANGYAPAQADLGLSYKTGKLGEVNLPQAVKWLRLAAQQENTEAEFQLGVCYLEGTGVTKDYYEAAKLFQKGAKKNNPQSQRMLAYLFENGLGVHKDYAEAANLYILSAEQDDAVSQFRLAEMYENGRGLAKNYARAITWYQRAAERKDGLAEHRLGELYENGRGVVKNLERAKEYYKRAISHGCTITRAEQSRLESLGIAF